MAPPTVLASDIMDTSAAYLNDTARRLYTNTVQLPYLRMAVEELEQLLAVYGVDISHKTSTAIDVTAGTTSLNLPNDFMVPIQLFERRDGATKETDWQEMTEVDEIPNDQPGESLAVWSFQDNSIKFVGATGNREVKLVYIRMLSAISGASSPIDEYKLKPWLSAKTAELCARFVGRNSPVADEIAASRVFPAEDSVIRLYVLNGQNLRYRHKPFTSKM